MKQDTLEWPWELQSSTLSDSWSSKSQKHDLHVQSVPSTDKDFQQQGPQKRQHKPFFVSNPSLHNIWAKSQGKPCSTLQAGNAAEAILTWLIFQDSKGHQTDIKAGC